MSSSHNLPVLPLRDVVVYPHMVVPLFVGREKSIAALEKAAKNGNELFLVTQKDASVLNPEREDVYDIGTVVNIIQMLRLPDNTVKVLIEGKHRARISDFECRTEGYYADVTKCEDETINEVEIEATVRSVKKYFRAICKA
jgi:ATP-dependent Lon protease